MTLLPFEKYSIQTKLTVEEITDRLLTITEKRKYFQIKSSSYIFEGDVMYDNFNINRNINYRNSFNPIIIGSISKNIHKRQINILLRMDSSVIIFMTVWFLITIPVLFFSIGTQLTNQTIDYDAVLFASAFPLFGYGLMIIGFKSEVKENKKVLAQIFEADK